MTHRHHVQLHIGAVDGQPPIGTIRADHTERSFEGWFGLISALSEIIADPALTDPAAVKPAIADPAAGSATTADDLGSERNA